MGKEPPHKIKLPKQGNMAREISESTFPLTSSLECLTPEVMNNGDSNEPQEQETQQSNIGHQKAEHDRLDHSDANKEESVGLAPRSRKKRKPKLKRVVKSFRKSFSLSVTSHDRGDGNVVDGAAVDGRRRKKKKRPVQAGGRKDEEKARVRPTSKIPPKRGIRKSMSSLGLSMKKVLIGELSSSSSDDSSSSDEEHSSNDDDSEDRERKQKKRPARPSGRKKMNPSSDDDSSDDDISVGGRKRGEKTAHAKTTSKIPRKRGIRKSMNSLGLSMKKVFIGELSSSSSDDSSSSDEEVSSSDDDSSSSSGSSSLRPNNKNSRRKAVYADYAMRDVAAPPPQSHRRHTASNAHHHQDNIHVGNQKEPMDGGAAVAPKPRRRQNASNVRHNNGHPKQPIDGTVTASSQRHRRHIGTNNHQIPNSGLIGHHKHHQIGEGNADRGLVQANADQGGSNRRLGVDRRLDKGDTAELFESELTTSNDYLPPGRLDVTREETAKLRPTLSRGSSERSNLSTGSKSRSLRSRPTLSRGGSSQKSNLSSRSSRSLHKQASSRGSSRRSFSERGGKRQERKAEFEGGKRSAAHQSKQRKPKSKRHNAVTNPQANPRGDSPHDHTKKERLTNPHKKLVRLKNSLTSSFNSLTRGTSLSDIAALALEEPNPPSRPDPHGIRASKHVARQEGGPIRHGGGGGRKTKSPHPHASPTRSDKDKERRKKSSSNKDKRRTKKKHHSKRTEQHGTADGTATKKKSRRKKPALGDSALLQLSQEVL